MKNSETVASGGNEKLISTDIVPLDADNYQAQEPQFDQQLSLLDGDLQDFKTSLEAMEKSLSTTTDLADLSAKRRYSRVVKYTMYFGALITLIIITGIEEYVLYDALHLISVLSLTLSSVSVCLTLAGKRPRNL